MRKIVVWGVPVVAAAVVATMSPVAEASSVVAMATAPGPSLNYTPAPGWWGTNGRVNDIRVVGDRVYLAGGFDYIGPSTGYGVTVDPDTGAVSPTTFPMVDGVVRTAVADGSGGWYIGGDFLRLGARNRLLTAHVLADGSIDANWAPDVRGGSVNAIARTPSGIILGGTFSSVNGTAVSRLAKVDATGALQTGWKGSANNTVRALAVYGGSVFVGGDFTTLSGSSRSRLGRVSDSVGLVDTQFLGTTGGAVRALATDPASGRLFAGGDFTTATGGGASTGRSRLAAFDLTTGVLSDFAPAVNASVEALAATGDGQLVIGGLFTTVGGFARNYLAMLSGTGSLSAFDAVLTECNKPHRTKNAHGLVPCSPEVSAVAVNGTTLYVGGRFGRSRGIERHDAAAYDIESGNLSAWNPVAGDRPLAIATQGTGDVFMGGEFTSTGGLVRKGLAALDASTGVGVPDFRADANEFVEVMVPSTDGSRLYVGGAFTTLQGQTRYRIASIVTATGVVDPAFAPKLNKGVLALAYAQGSVYVGGKFTKVKTTPRLRAAKLDGATGAVDPNWVANTFGPSGALRSDGMVMGIEATPDGATVFLGGPFTTVNGTSVPGGLAVVSGSSGALGPHQLGGVAGCGSIGPWINRLYLSDDGKRLYGGDVCPDYVYQWDAVNLSTTSNPTGLVWRNLCNGGMQGRLEVNGHFYYGTHGGDKGNGGRCQAYPGGPNVAQQRYFVFDGGTGTLLPDAPEFDSPMGIWSFAAMPSGLLAGGDFTFAGARGNVQQGLAFFPGVP